MEPATRSRRRSGLGTRERARAEIAGSPVELERPADPEHGDYATNVALRLAPTRRQSPRELASRDRRPGSGPRSCRARRGRRPRLRQSARLRRMDRGGARRDPGRRRLVRCLSPGDAAANAGRDGVREPHGASDGRAARNGAFGDSVARLLTFAGKEVEREYYYNDAGRQMERFHASVDAVRRGEEPPGGRLPRGVHPGARRARPAIPAAEMLRPHRGIARPLRGSISTRGRVRASSNSGCPSSCRDSTPTRARAPSGRAPRGTETSRTASSSARTASRRTAPQTCRTSRTSCRAGSTARSTSSARTTTVRAVVRGDREDARLRPGAGRGAHLPARPARRMRARRGRCRSAVGTSCSSTSCSTRSGSTRPAGTSSREARTRRSRSTSTSRPSERRRTPSTTSSTRTRASRGSCGMRTANGAAAPNAGASASPLAVEERDLVKRLLEFPALAAEAAERRAPQGIPTYAIRVADDFHRFYHHHRVLGTRRRRAFASISAERRSSSSPAAWISSG